MFYENDYNYFDLEITKNRVEIIINIDDLGIMYNDVIKIDSDVFIYLKNKIEILYDKKHQDNINSDKERTFDKLYEIMGMGRQRKIKKFLEDDVD